MARCLKLAGKEIIIETMETKQRILLCEDEESLGMLLREYLQAKGYDAELYLDGEAGYRAFMKGHYDMK